MADYVKPPAIYAQAEDRELSEDEMNRIANELRERIRERFGGILAPEGVTINVFAASSEEGGDDLGVFDS